MTRLLESDLNSPMYSFALKLKEKYLFQTVSLEGAVISDSMISVTVACSGLGDVLQSGFFQKLL